jgi:hypothetical protein
MEHFFKLSWKRGIIDPLAKLTHPIRCFYHGLIPLLSGDRMVIGMFRAFEAQQHLFADPDALCQGGALLRGQPAGPHAAGYFHGHEHVFGPFAMHGGGVPRSLPSRKRTRPETCAAPTITPGALKVQPRRSVIYSSRPDLRLTPYVRQHPIILPRLLVLIETRTS